MVITMLVMMVKMLKVMMITNTKLSIPSSVTKIEISKLKKTKYV